MDALASGTLLLGPSYILRMITKGVGVFVWWSLRDRNTRHMKLCALLPSMAQPSLAYHKK